MVAACNTKQQPMKQKPINDLFVPVAIADDHACAVESHSWPDETRLSVVVQFWHQLLSVIVDFLLATGSARLTSSGAHSTVDNEKTTLYTRQSPSENSYCDRLSVLNRSAMIQLYPSISNSSRLNNTPCCTSLSINEILVFLHIELPKSTEFSLLCSLL